MDPKDSKALTTLFLRVVIAAIFLWHGVPKLTRWGAEEFILGLPGFLWGVLGVVEVVAAVLLLIGLWHKYASYALAVVILGAIVFVQIKGGINPGLERDVLLLAGALLLAVHGMGPIAVRES